MSHNNTHTCERKSPLCAGRTIGSVRCLTGCQATTMTPLLLLLVRTTVTHSTRMTVLVSWTMVMQPIEKVCVPLFPFVHGHIV